MGRMDANGVWIEDTPSNAKVVMGPQVDPIKPGVSVGAGYDTEDPLNIYVNEVNALARAGINPYSMYQNTTANSSQISQQQKQASAALNNAATNAKNLALEMNRFEHEKGIDISKEARGWLGTLLGAIPGSSSGGSTTIKTQTKK